MRNNQTQADINPIHKQINAIEPILVRLFYGYKQINSATELARYQNYPQSVNPVGVPTNMMRSGNGN